jgi:hypothetical protein
MIKVTVGYKQQLGVVVKDQYGNVIENPPVPAWSFNTDVASVDTNGLLTAGTLVGSGEVSATINVDGVDIVGVETVELVAGAAASVEVVAAGEAYL